MGERESKTPVVGEMMVMRVAARENRSASPDIVDAEYETLGRLAAQTLPGSAFAETIAPNGLAMLRRTRKNGRRSSGGEVVFWTLGIIAAIGAFWISGGHTLLTTDDVDGSAPLRIADVQSEIQNRRGGVFLRVSGAAVNNGFVPVQVPELSIDILDQKGHTIRYFLGTRSGPLGAGERLAFSSRFAPPKDGVKSVSVKFREYVE